VFGGHGYINSFCNLNNHEITQIITREIIYRDYIIWDGKDDQPLEDYIEIANIPDGIMNIIVKNDTLKVGQSGDGRYTLMRSNKIGYIAKSTLKEKIDALKELIMGLTKNEAINKRYSELEDELSVSKIKS